MVAMFTRNFNAFRLYDDDAGEAASAQLAAQNTNYSIDADSDVAFQLRVRIDETGGADGTTMDDYILEYSKNTGGFVALTTTDIGDGVRAVAAGLTNDNATTNRSSEPISDPGGGAFVAGEQSSDGVVDDMQLTASDFTEHAFGIEFVSANVADADTFDFRFSNSTISNNNVTPQLTIVKTGGGNQPIVVGLITENESLFSPAVILDQAIVVGLITENESLFAAAPSQGDIIVVGLITENESLFAATPVPVVSITVGLITENESLFVTTPVPSISITVGLITENETLFTITPIPGIVGITTGLITENESLFSSAVAQGDIITVGQITENESLFVTTPAPGNTSITVGLITENETLFSPTVVTTTSITVGLITENESLFSVSIIVTVSITVSQITENESLFAAIVGGGIPPVVSKRKRLFVANVGKMMG